MRTALLSALKRTETGDLRAFMPLSGRSVLAWQLDVVRALGCQRIICLCDASDPQVLEFRDEVGATDLQFHAIQGPMQLVSLVTSDQDLVIMLDGLVVAPDLAKSLLQNGRQIASMPADAALAGQHPHDFERIDANRAWAGLAAIHASLAEKLGDFPADSDTVSMLLRLGLQASVKDAPLHSDELSSGDILLATDAQALAERQDTLIARSAEALPWTGPGRALAGAFVHRFAPAGLERGPVIASGLGLAALIGMVIAFWLEQSIAGLFLGAAGSFALAFSRAGSRLKSKLYGLTENDKISPIFSILQDGLIAISLAIPALSPVLSPAQAALPMLGIGLARLATKLENGAIHAFWADRTLHLTLLAICAIFGQLPLGIAVFALLALANCLLRTRAI